MADSTARPSGCGVIGRGRHDLEFVSSMIFDMAGKSSKQMGELTVGHSVGKLKIAIKMPFKCHKNATKMPQKCHSHHPQVAFLRGFQPCPVGSGGWRDCLLSRMKIDAVHFVLRRLHGAMEDMEDMDMAPQIIKSNQLDIKSPVTKYLFQTVNQRKFWAVGLQKKTHTVFSVTRWNRWNRPGGPSPRRASRFASLPMASGMAAWQVDATRGHRPVAPVLWFQRYTCLRWNQGDSPRGKNDVPEAMKFISYQSSQSIVANLRYYAIPLAALYVILVYTYTYTYIYIFIHIMCIYIYIIYIRLEPKIRHYRTIRARLTQIHHYIGHQKMPRSHQGTKKTWASFLGVAIF